MNDSDEAKMKQVIHAIPAINCICLDVANGYSEHFTKHVREIREQYPEHIIMAGNVVSGEMIEQLILDGADIIKVSKASFSQWRTCLHDRLQ